MANEFIARKGLIISGTTIAAGAISASHFSGSGVNITGVISSSFATTASAATSLTFTPTTASYAQNADLLDGINSTTFATTGSNTFVGTQFVSASNVIISTGSIRNNGALVLSAGGAPNVTLNVVGGQMIFDANTALFQFRVNTNSSTAISLDGGRIYPTTNLGASVGGSGNRWAQGWINALFTSGSSIFTGSLEISGSGFTGSLSGNATTATTSSYALTSTWFGLTNIPVGLVSSSNQISYTGLSDIPVGIVSSSTQASAWTVATSSVATSASYALSASWAPGGSGTPFNLGISRTGSIAGNNISHINFFGGGVQGLTITGATASIEFSAGVVTSASYALSASWAPGGSPQSFTRTTTIMSTSVLAQSAFETGTVSVASGFILYRVATTVPARVRLYMTTTARNDDQYRGTNVEPTGNHQIIIDVLTTTTALTATLAPIPYGAVMDEPLTTAVPYTITNNQTGSAAVTASFIFLPLE